MEHPARQILYARPRHPRRGSSIIVGMQSTSPIRRYLLLRHRGQDAAAPGWSVVRLAPAAREPGSTPAVAGQEAKRTRNRGA
jgi:hypothetical protein